MATRTTFGKFAPSDKNEVDLVDVAALMLVPITGAMIFGVWSMQINVFGGYDFTQPIWTIGGADISAALLITLFGDLWIIGTNLYNQDTDHETQELAAIGFALLAPVMYVFVPAFATFVESADVIRLAMVLYLAGASVYVSYTG
ncbi:hypothetical protein ACFO5R_08790 [Halosolutus amylolyticus]|uniref:Uncharacterized protein n=1 Tax=Halosolutus amylolyticus TaxID=2932267 RepID=A0ABD5PNJ3_9EURY|nr:hypothetical protein [Halosolutus amylolyticus]